MIVIKLGGSLAQSGALIHCLNKIQHRYQGRAVIIVPGGGGFADVGHGDGVFSIHCIK